MEEWTAVQNIIKMNNSFLLFTHISADGDSLGSAFSLAVFLKKQGKKVKILMEEEPPRVLRFITCQDVDFSVYDECCNYDSYDVSIAVDTATQERLGKRVGIFYKSPITVSIDHHPADKIYAQTDVRNPMWAACCEGIWELLQTYGPICDKQIAQLIFTGIMTDTGCFAYSNTTQSTHSIAAQIIALCGDQSWQYRQVFESVEKSELELRSIAYSKLEFYGKETICYLEITQQEIDKCKATTEQLEGFAAFLRTINGVKTGIFVKPGVTPQTKRISLRSDGNCNVSAVANAVGGGGHRCAAGATYSPEKSQVTFEEFKAKLIEDIITWTE